VHQRQDATLSTPHRRKIEEAREQSGKKKCYDEVQARGTCEARGVAYFTHYTTAVAQRSKKDTSSSATRYPHTSVTRLPLRLIASPSLLDNMEGSIAATTRSSALRTTTSPATCTPHCLDTPRPQRSTESTQVPNEKNVQLCGDAYGALHFTATLGTKGEKHFSYNHAHRTQKTKQKKTGTRSMRGIGTSGNSDGWKPSYECTDGGTAQHKRKDWKKEGWKEGGGAV
jgi:hypothetical protein